MASAAPPGGGPGGGGGRRDPPEKPEPPADKPTEFVPCPEGQKFLPYQYWDSVAGKVSSKFRKGCTGAARAQRWRQDNMAAYMEGKERRAREVAEAAAKGLPPPPPPPSPPGSPPRE